MMLKKGVVFIKLSKKIIKIEVTLHSLFLIKARKNTCI